MTYDLHRDLPELGAHARAAVPDLPTEDLVHELRRRRTVRSTLRAAGALVVVGGLVAGGVALADVRRPVPPAETPTDFSSCGRTPEELGWVQDGPFFVQMYDTHADDAAHFNAGSVQIVSYGRYAGEAEVPPEPAIVALRDGRVAGVLGPDAPRQGDPASAGERVGILYSCSNRDAPLGAGRYDLLAASPVSYRTFHWEAKATPIAGMAVGHSSVVIADRASSSARARDALWSDRQLPECGTRPETTWTRPIDTGLRIDVDIPAAISGADAPLTEPVVTILNETAPDVATQLLDTPPSSVLTEDGVVVSSDVFIPGLPAIDLAPSSARAFQYSWMLHWGCGLPEGAERGTIPAGAYELWIAVPVEQDGAKFWAIAGPWAFAVGEGGPTLAGTGVPTDVPLVYDMLLGVADSGPDGPWRVDARLGLAGMLRAVEDFEPAGGPVVVEEPSPDATGRHVVEFTNGTWDVVLDVTGDYYEAVGAYEISRP